MWCTEGFENGIYITNCIDRVSCLGGCARNYAQQNPVSLQSSFENVAIIQSELTNVAIIQLELAMFLIFCFSMPSEIDYFLILIILFF